MSAPQFSHEQLCPLADPSKELRVLEIIENAHHVIECRLVKNTEGQKYNTLSWCWGSQKQNIKQIRIIQSSQTYEFSVPESLYIALQELRIHRVLRIWVDYVCIDQSNFNEKNNQVPMMAKIYGDAECVYVWLGEKRDDSELAMSFIRDRVLSLGDFDRLIRDENTVAEWRALSALIKRPWFSRRWIVQEIAVARTAIILCGPHKIKWKDLADAISLFNEIETGTRRISEVMRADRDLGHIPDFFGEVSALSATKLVEVTNNLFRQLSGNGQQAQFNLEYLVSTFTMFDASEPRDTIYALLAIARDTIPVTTLKTDAIRKWTWPDFIKQKLIDQLAKRTASKPYNVDYGLPLSDVYVQFIRWAVDRSDKTSALDIICRPWAPQPAPSGEVNDADEESDPRAHWRVRTKSSRPQDEGEDTLPSWIPTAARAAFGMDGTGQKMTRKNADSLVGLPPERIYSAAGTRVLTENFRIEDGVTKFSDDRRLNELHYHSMFVEGFVLDHVRDLRYPSQQGVIPSDWLKLARRRDLDGELSDEFWRTIVADRGPTGGNAPRYYPRLVDHALRQGVQGDSLNTENIVNWGNCTIVGEVLRRVRSSIWNRKMMRTENGSFGLAPELTQRDDLICILYGCSVPVLLRKFTKTQAEVEEEDRQRQRKREALQEKREKEAALKISQIWRDRLATRKTTSSGPQQPSTPGRKRKAASTAGSTPSRKKQRRRTRSSHDDTTDTPAGSSSTSGAPGRGPAQDGDSPTRKPVDDPTKTDKTPLKSDPYTYYQLIGECYVDGMMNGEALSRLQPSMIFEMR
ncbi:HET-domain-containing protein [Hypoxylon sp. NC1633]|nr:HET-domain-containing protein [Hypoxylon sp. NC1633]